MRRPEQHFYFLSDPVTAFLLNIGSMYLLYLTPLYKESLTKPYLHYVMHLHFLAAGYLFTWSMIGPDPAPRRPGLRVRVFVLFISIASHAFLSKLMYAYLYPLNSPHPAAQIRDAAKLMYYWGDLSELLLTIALFAIWYQKWGRHTTTSARLFPDRTHLTSEAGEQTLSDAAFFPLTRPKNGRISVKYFFNFQMANFQ